MSTTQHQKDRYLGSTARPRERGIPGAGGLITLGSTAKRTKAGSKLAVPKPVNLPSLKKEHAGTISTALAARGQGWPGDDELPDVGDVQSSLIEKATWAAEGGGGPARTSPAPSWHPPPIFNPYEFPSLGDEPPRPPPAPLGAASRSGNWDEDERAGGAAPYRPESRGSRSQDYAGRGAEDDAPPYGGGDYRVRGGGPGRYWREERGGPSWEGGARGRPPPHQQFAGQGYYTPREARYGPQDARRADGYGAPDRAYAYERPGERWHPSDDPRWPLDGPRPQHAAETRDWAPPPSPPAQHAPELFPPPPAYGADVDRERSQERPWLSRHERARQADAKPAHDAPAPRDEERDAFNAELQRMVREMKEAERRASAGGAGEGAAAPPGEPATAAAVVAGAASSAVAPPPAPARVLAAARAVPVVPSRVVPPPPPPPARVAEPVPREEESGPAPAQAAAASLAPPPPSGAQEAYSILDRVPAAQASTAVSSVGSTSSAPASRTLERSPQRGPRADEAAEMPVSIPEPPRAATPTSMPVAVREASAERPRAPSPVAVAAPVAPPPAEGPGSPTAAAPPRAILRRPVPVPISRATEPDGAARPAPAKAPSARPGPAEGAGQIGGRRVVTVPVSAKPASGEAAGAARAGARAEGPKGDRAARRGKEAAAAKGGKSAGPAQEGGKNTGPAQEGGKAPEGAGPPKDQTAPAPEAAPPRTVMGTKSWRAVLSGIPDASEEAAAATKGKKGRKAKAAAAESARKEKKAEPKEPKAPEAGKTKKERKRGQPTAILPRPPAEQGEAGEAGAAAPATEGEAAQPAIEDEAAEPAVAVTDTEPATASSLGAQFTWSLSLADEVARLQMAAPEDPLGPGALELLPSLGSDLGLGDDAPPSAAPGAESLRRYEGAAAARGEGPVPSDVADPFALPGGASSLFAPVALGHGARGAGHPVWSSAEGPDAHHLLSGGFFGAAGGPASAAAGAYGVAAAHRAFHRPGEAPDSRGAAQYGAVAAAFGHETERTNVPLESAFAGLEVSALGGVPATPALGWAPTGLPPDWSSPQSRAGPSRDGVGPSALGAARARQPRPDAASLDPAASLPDDVFDESAPLAVLDASSLLLAPRIFYPPRPDVAVPPPPPPGRRSRPLLDASQPLALGSHVLGGFAAPRQAGKGTAGPEGPWAAPEAPAAAKAAQDAAAPAQSARGGRARGGRGGRGRGGAAKTASPATGADSAAPTPAPAAQPGGAKSETPAPKRGGGAPRWRGARPKANGKAGGEAAPAPRAAAA